MTAVTATMVMTARAAGLALIVALAACGGHPAPAGGTAGSASGDAGSLDACTQSDDCALVEACCGCNAGGHQLAIRKDAVPRFEASRPARCGQTMCPQFISHDASCDAVASCNTMRGTCVVAPNLHHKP